MKEKTDTFTRYSLMTKEETQLPFNVWVMESQDQESSEAEVGIKYQLDDLNEPDIKKTAIMFLSGRIKQGKRYEEKTITADDEKLLNMFMTNNAEALEVLAEERIALQHFKNVMFKGPEPIALCKTQDILQKLKVFEAEKAEADRLEEERLAAEALRLEEELKAKKLKKKKKV